MWYYVYIICFRYVLTPQNENIKLCGTGVLPNKGLIH